MKAFRALNKADSAALNVIPSFCATLSTDSSSTYFNWSNLRCTQLSWVIAILIRLTNSFRSSLCSGPLISPTNCSKLANLEKAIVFNRFFR